MSKHITYQNKTQTIKQWSLELNIPLRTIYGRLDLGWPPQLILNKNSFHFCNDLRVALRLQKQKDYPTTLHDHVKNNSCCTSNSICNQAIPISDYNFLNPAENNYYCKLLKQFIVGNNPICKL